jgi:hypothetical protein
MEFFNFIVLINEDPFSKHRLLEKFARFLDDWGVAGVHPREATCGFFSRWSIEVLFDKQGHMYLHTGWEKFDAPTSWRTAAS